jgi:hypothetical protein
VDGAAQLHAKGRAVLGEIDSNAPQQLQQQRGMRGWEQSVRLAQRT